MTEQCEEARTQLRLAEERLEAAELAHEDAGLTKRLAEGELSEAGYDYERAVAGAKGHDDRVVETERQVDERQRAYDAIAAGNDLNREALLTEAAEKLRAAEWDHRDAVSSSENAWAQAKELAAVQESKQRALESARTNLDAAESRMFDARSEAKAAAGEVASACS